MHDRWDSLQGLLDCRTADELRERTDRHVHRLGFSNWIYGSGDTLKPAPAALDAYPPEWTAHYRQHRYFEIDPVIDHCRYHTTPCLWAADPSARRVGYLTDFFREAVDYGLRVGIGLPIHGPRGASAMITVATDDIAQARPNLGRLGELQLLASFLHEAGNRITQSGRRQTADGHLTERELDCLRWAAEGRTSWDIGQQLGISERTVVFHLQNAARKLGVLGRRQAIAKAMSLHLLSL
jgi:DNA-binding CsgD family transcriptional regulator